MQSEFRLGSLPCMKHPLLIPMALYVFYIWSLALYNFRTRLRAIKNGQVSLKYFKTYADPAASERVIVVGRHYDNQFQLPLLFLITCALHLTVASEGPATLAFAWAFVISRFFHS
ncbi:MAG: MAPEG family protein, partial [Bdellovibrionales bacterium]